MYYLGKQVYILTNQVLFYYLLHLTLKYVQNISCWLLEPFQDVQNLQINYLLQNVNLTIPFNTQTM